ncbi:MAG: EscU/YscU/HrcU family type III secretion system export apparatus switch protein [Bryobacteraceae bacterium]|jgi:flagellar biosynthetic protein FlhB
MNPSGEKTEKATPRRLIKARREGQFASSHDFVSGLQFTVFVLLIAQTGPSLLSSLKEVTRGLFMEAFRGDLGPATLIGILHEALSRGLSPLLYASGILILTALAFQLSSTGFSFSLTRMLPKPSNFDVFQKLQSLPQKGLVSSIQAVALVAVFGATIYWIVTKSGERLLMIPLSSFQVGLETLRSLIMDLLWKAAALFLLFGFVDFFRQKRKFSKQMRMSKQDIRDEAKENEGNPQTKMRIRRLQRDVRRRRMMDEVKTATAVVVNPTHYAVAIRYHHDTMAAPLVVAKGKNYLALRIRARALEFGVPLIENPPLAQALYKSVEVGQHIPPHLYRAVAEILAYIYRLMGARAVS